MFIAVSGNIGSGKSTLVEILSEKLNLTPYFESVDNPYIDDFYRDMPRWAFQLQIAFLGKKIQQLHQISSDRDNIIQDRTIYEEAYIFVCNLNKMGLLSTRDYNTYMSMFNQMCLLIPQPDLVIYLKASRDTLLSQIYKRGRDFEMNISPDYIESLNVLYEDWITTKYKGKVITIDIDNFDFVIDPRLIDVLIEQLQPMLAKNNNNE